MYFNFLTEANCKMLWIMKFLRLVGVALKAISEIPPSLGIMFRYSKDKSWAQVSVSLYTKILLWSARQNSF